jgi:RNA polymerase sigma-70 factor, ECF subfamily
LGKSVATDCGLEAVETFRPSPALLGQNHRLHVPRSSGEVSLKADDRSWLEPLIRVAARPAVRFAYMQVRNIDLAQDIVQEAFARVCASPKTPRLEPEFRRWLYRIITNLVADHNRQRLRTSNLVARVSVMGHPIDDVDKSAGDPDLMAAIAGLSIRERQALYLRYFEDLSFAETAAILRMPSVTVRVIVHRALGRLRRRLSTARTSSEVAV